MEVRPEVIRQDLPNQSLPEKIFPKLAANLQPIHETRAEGAVTHDDVVRVVAAFMETLASDDMYYISEALVFDLISFTEVCSAMESKIVNQAILTKQNLGSSRKQGSL